MLVRVAALAALGGFLFGYDLGLIGGAMLGISQALNITSNTTKQAIVGAAKLGAFFGTFIGGVLMLRYGRRLAIAFEAGFFVLGPLLMAAATGPGALVAGRLLIGLGVGASAIVVPAYLAEIAPADRRGAVVQTYEMMLTLGMLCAGVVDWVLSSTVGVSAWRWMVGLPALPGTLLLVSLALLPESPRWLVLRGQLDLALATLHKIITSSSKMAGAEPDMQSSESQALARAEDELLLLWSSVQKEQAAGLMLRQQRQQQQTTPGEAAMTNGRTGAARHAHLNGSAHQQQPGSPAANGYQPPAVGPEAAGRPGFAPAAAAADVFTLDDAEDATDDNSQPTTATKSPTEAPAGRVNGPVPAGGSQRSSLSADDDEDNSSKQQHQVLHKQHEGEQYPAADDSQFEQLLNHNQHHSSSATAGQHGSAAAGRGVWLRGWLRGQRQHQDMMSGSSAPGTAHPHQQQQQQQQQCEPGHEANVFASLWAMLADIATVVRGPEKAAFAIAASLAVFNQATASTAVINYTPEVLSSVLGVTENGSAILYPAVITVTKCVGVGISLLVVDAWGRRPLMVWGGAGCGAALLLAGVALAVSSVPLFLGCLCLFIFSFSISWAGLYWVVVSEIFSMGAKSPASSAATSLLFLTGSVVDFVFLSLVGWLGAGAFALFGAVAFGSAWYVYRSVPETKGRTLVEIQALLAAPAAAGGGSGGGAAVSGGVVRYGRWRGWDWGRTTSPAAAAAAAARAASVMRPQAGELTPLQEQQQQPRSAGPAYTGNGDQAQLDRDEGQGSGTAPAGKSSVDSMESGGQYWQHWMRQQQQQQSTSVGGMALPLGLELTPAGGRHSRHARQGGHEALVDTV